MALLSCKSQCLTLASLTLASLVSADFIASEYCWANEMRRAMARYEAGEAAVIPVIARDCNWRATPFAIQQALFLKMAKL